MKLLLSIFLLTTLNTCASQQTTIIEISYEASTRGSTITISTNKHQLDYKDNSIQKNNKLTIENWKSLITSCSKFDLKHLESFNPPSDQRTTDAALHATITIKTNNTVFQSQTFDHGNPPEELKKLVTELFTLAEIE